MQENLKEILSHLSNDIDQETLLQYLQDQLSAEKKHEVEKILADNPFANDAIDGLQQMGDKKKIGYMVEMLNRDLKKKTEQKIKRKEKFKLPNQTILAITALILFLLIVISFMVIHKLRNP